MKSPCLSLLLAISVTTSLPTQAATDCTSVTEIPFMECTALLDLYHNTQGTGWTNNSGWNSTNTPCSWHEIKCSDNHVTSINLAYNNLIGSIPAKLGELTNLQYLRLSSNNQLTGVIPAEFGNLSNLQGLLLFGNQLTGAIPTELGKLSNLQILDLGFNQLTGVIPAELGNLSSLQILGLEFNYLTGTIPAELGNLSSLQTLDLGFNQLMGAIPVELGRLSSLQTLDLGLNHLTGAIPAELGKLSNLQRLNLDFNHLTGPIPAELGKLFNLQNLSLGSNHLTGAIPAELGNLSNLQYLTLNDNQLMGVIPAELGKLSHLRILDLHFNQLTGAIPAELGKLSSLYSLDLSYNHLQGAFSPSLQSLNLSDGYNRMRCNTLNIAISDPALVNFLNTKIPDWKYQDPTSHVCTILPNLRGGNTINSQGEESFTLSSFSGGVAVNLGNYQNPSTFSLSDQIEIRGVIQVVTEDVGRIADIFAYAETTFPFSSDTFYYGLGEGLNIYEWDQRPIHLVPLMKNVSLEVIQSVTLYQGNFYYPGLLKLFFGYRLGDGTLVRNNDPIVIEIKG